MKGGDGYRLWCNHGRTFLGLSSECGEAGFRVRADPASCIFRVSAIGADGLPGRIDISRWDQNPWPLSYLWTVARATGRVGTGTPVEDASEVGPIRLPGECRPRPAAGLRFRLAGRGRPSQRGAASAPNTGSDPRAGERATTRTGATRTRPQTSETPPVVCAGRRSSKSVAQDPDTGARSRTGAPAARARRSAPHEASGAGRETAGVRAGYSARPGHIRRASRE